MKKVNWKKVLEALGYLISALLGMLGGTML